MTNVVRLITEFILTLITLRVLNVEQDLLTPEHLRSIPVVDAVRVVQSLFCVIFCVLCSIVCLLIFF